MEIQPYKSGRKGLFGPLALGPDGQVLRSGTQSFREGSFALDARIAQEDAFCHESQGSLRYLLLLSGVLPNICEIDDPIALNAELQAIAPDASPGTHGPIAIVLAL